MNAARHGIEVLGGFEIGELAGEAVDCGRGELPNAGEILRRSLDAAAGNLGL